MSEPLIDIRPDHWAIIADILRRHVPDREVWAFGSRATWNAKEYSDLDLAVIGETPLSLSVSAALADDFSESDLPFKVDVVDWATTSESFRKIIERDKVMMQIAAKHRVDGEADEWTVRPLEDCVAALIDYRGKTPRKTSFGIPLITAKVVKGGRIETPDEFIAVDDYEPWMRRGIPKPGDVVITTEAPLGEVAQLGPEHVALAQRLIVLRGKEGLLENAFLKFLMQSEEVQQQLRARASGTTVLGIKQSELRKVLLSLPPIKEQRAIAHILGTLDDKIELNRRMNETLEAMARALFKSWFVDFDPVRAEQPKVGWVSPSGRNPPDKTDGGLRGYAANPPYELPPHLADLFPARLVNSELGEIPEGWEVRTLGDFSSLNPETWTKETRPAVINYLDLSNTKWGRIEAVMAYAQQDAPSRAQRVLRLRDTIVGTVRPGNGSYAFIFEDGLTGSTGFAVLRPLSLEYAEFVYVAATAAENIEALSHLADGGAYPAVRPEVVAATQVIKSGDDLIGRYSRVAGPLLAKMAENERESRTLAALRDTLLPKLLSGTIRIKDTAKFIEEAL